MNLAGLVTDPYNRRARLQPALLALLPVGLVALIVFPGVESKAATLLGIAAYFGGATWLTQVGRGLGKRLEPKLFQSWDGMPSVSMLRHRDTRLNKITKERYHTFLSANVPNLELPGADEESSDPSTADSIYESANDWLLRATRGKDESKLIFEENMNYGFRRNFWALRPIALLVDMALIVATVWLTSFNQNIQASFAQISMATLIALAVVGVHMVIVLSATKRWVRMAAEAYAKQLLSACDSL
ncbi:hypothetical protein [Marinobacter sp. KMM 10035]|uniref:hypothetical protein n=1 Tax=Marinobacter sp. KMM 10035 TaxID=3134034 RepID=UPI00397D452F